MKYSCSDILLSQEKANPEIYTVMWKNGHDSHCHYHNDGNSYRRGLNVLATEHLAHINLFLPLRTPM